LGTVPHRFDRNREMLANARKRRPGLDTTAPRVEPLEDRVLLSTFWWIGSRTNLSWSAPSNWASNARPGALPTSSDTVIFSTTDPHSPRRVINPASVLDAAFRGGAVGILRIDRGYTGALTLTKGLTVADSFTQAGGTITGGGTLTLQRTVLWYGGTMSGTGTTAIQGTEALGYGANSQIGAQPVTLDRRQLVIQTGAGVLFGGASGIANMTLKNGASIVNQGYSLMMTAPTGGLATMTGQGAFWNSGTVQVGLTPSRPTQGPPDQGIIPPAPSPLVAFRFDVQFNDLGNVSVQPNAWLWLSGGGSSDGAFTTAASTSGQLGNVLFTGQGATASTWDRATFQGPGTVFLAGSASVLGRTVADNFTFVAGQLSLGSMAVSSAFSWLSGTMTGSGIFVLNQGASGQIGFAGDNPALTLLAPTLAAALTGVVSSTAPALAQGAVFSNAGSLAMQSAGGGAGLLLNGNALSHFDNGGTFTIQDSSGIGGGANAVFNNLPGAVFQRANPGLPAAPITAVVSNAGTILPGSLGLPGLLAVSGNLVEQAGASIDIDINGNTAGAGYDQVSATGLVSLGGTLNVSLNGYVPQPNDVFQIFAFPGGYTGTFASVNLPPIFGMGSAYAFQLVYGPTGVSLVVVPASGAGTSSGPSAPVIAGQPFVGPVAWFVGWVPGGTAGSYTATINWGNGTTTAGTIWAANANIFQVIGGTTYSRAGTYAVSITISDSSGNSTTVMTLLTVAPAAGPLPTGPFAVA
jgi:hypothetical protein